MVPPTPAVVISASDCHAVVCRYRPLPGGALVCECAANAEALEAEAVAALATHDQPFSLGVHYPCPPELAARAEWH